MPATSRRPATPVRATVAFEPVNGRDPVGPVLSTMELG